MPPSGHSSSSHSSRSSGSSSRSSSSRSSSSRSSGSSYRSPSAHSSSSRASSSYSSGSSSSRSSRPSPYQGPSKHSGSSWSSPPREPKNSPPREPARPQEPIWRPRVNQPTGFVMATHLRPTYYYGKRHSYAYYPQDWVDTETGISYQKGYYDENGQRYDSVTFEEDGRYKNVVCHCPYCEQETILDLSVSDLEGRALKCPNCGGPTEIVSELDAKLRSPGGGTQNTHDYKAEESLQNAFPVKKKKSRVWPIVLAVLLLLGVARRLGERAAARDEPYGGGQVQQISLVEKDDEDQSAVYLEEQADGSYRVVTDVVRADKILYYDWESDSYYDEETACWLWRNTDVEPPVWQYWVEGISSDYGDYGWMEHDDTGWYIEASAGSWIPVPDEYDTSDLWYIG